MIELSRHVALILVVVAGIGWVLWSGLLLDDLHAIGVLFDVRTDRQPELRISLRSADEW